MQVLNIYYKLLMHYYFVYHMQTEQLGRSVEFTTTYDVLTHEEALYETIDNVNALTSKELSTHVKHTHNNILA